MSIRGRFLSLFSSIENELITFLYPPPPPLGAGGFVGATVTVDVALASAESPDSPTPFTAETL